jgi:acetyltransferase
VVEALIRVGQLSAEQPLLKELDLNPLLADKDGVIALDARIRVQEARTAPLAIRPYPNELERDVLLQDGSTLFLRPLLPEDEALLQDLYRHMTPEDQRLRFFAPMKELSHRLAARLSQLDYDREMAFIAFGECRSEALGIARYAADPDNCRAEYAIGVRSDRQGMGIGTALMQAIIGMARDRGIGEIAGDVLTENRKMLQLCRELGFAVQHHPTDPILSRVLMRLT